MKRVDQKLQQENINISEINENSKKILIIAAYISIVSSVLIIFSLLVFGVLYISNYDAIQIFIKEFLIEELHQSVITNISLAINIIFIFIFTLFFVMSILSLFYSNKILKKYYKIDSYQDFFDVKKQLIKISIVYLLTSPGFISSICVWYYIIANENKEDSKNDKINKRILELNESFENGEISEYRYKEQLEKMIKKY